MENWVLFTLLAVVGQSVRTAAQKQIARSISVGATTLVRFLFGLPFAIAYFLVLQQYYGIVDLQLGSQFFIASSLAGISQILATLCLVQALTVHNFAVGTALAKTEALLAALLGTWFFSETLNALGYLSVMIGVAGALVASNWKISFHDLVNNASIKYGLGAGLGFALASLWIRDASLSLEQPRLFSAAAVLVYMVLLQTVICLVWVALSERQQLHEIRSNWRASWFIGFTGVAGSIGWFTAMSLQKAALVRTLGQTEFLVTLLITWLYFGERINGREYVGILLVAVSLLLLFAA